MVTRRTFMVVSALTTLTRPSAHAAPLAAMTGDQTKVLQLAIDTAIARDGIVNLGAGTFRTGLLRINGAVTLQGVPGLTKLRSEGGGQLLNINNAAVVVLRDVSFLAKGVVGDLVAVENVPQLLVENCSFAGGGTGMRLQACGGRVIGNSFGFHQASGLFSQDATGLEISGNRVSDIGNNGILVWRSEIGEDGTLVTNNRISRIAVEDGGTGQNGNGINVFRAGNVIVANNRITDCGYSGIRDNSASNVVVTGNTISRTGEVALYVEFAFQGAVVANNIIEDAGFGISITNFDQGGRLAVCDGNVVRRIIGATLHGGVQGIGIAVEADTIVSNNVVESASHVGIHLGWGGQTRNLQAIGNIVRDCPLGIAVSIVKGAAEANVTNNMIDGSKKAAIVGMNYAEVATDDLAVAGAKVPELIRLSGNIIRN